MAVTDPIADMLARLRNGHTALHKKVVMPASKMKTAIAAILKDEGYIDDFASAAGETGENLSVTLKYARGRGIIAGLKRISKPGRRVYVGVEDIPRVQNGLGICIVSTSRGLLSGETARAGNLGGELLCEIW
jgi:small subunit ribosomal protein S8